MQPGYSQPPMQPPPVGNNMTVSIVSLFLFLPLGIVAVINASKVNPALRAGDYTTAYHAAAESRRWSKLAIIIGICVWIVALICCGVLVASGNNGGSVN